MADPQKKLVKVDDSIVAFPKDMGDEHIAIAIKNFRAKKKPNLTTEESEHARQLKPAQPLSSVIPTLPDWAKTPLVSGPDNPSVEAIAPDSAKESAANARLLKATQPARTWLEQHPNTHSALDIGAGVEQGIAGTAQGMSSPANIALMIVSPESKVLSGLFTLQALRGSYKDAQAAKQAYMQGKNQEGTRLVTQALLGAGMASVAGTHALKDTALGNAIQADMQMLVKGGRESEHGFVENPLAPKQPQLKPTSVYKSVDQSQPFYLKSENIIADKMKGPMPAADVQKMLLSNGVKPEEMKWTGLDELLQGKGKNKVTPQEIQEHLAGNNLQVQEIMHGEQPKYKREELKLDEWGSSDPKYSHLWRIQAPGQYFEIAKRNYPTLEDAMNHIVSEKTRSDVYVPPTKHSSWQVPGAEPGSYRELLVTVPNLGRDATHERLVNDYRAAEKASYDYMESHKQNLSAPDEEMKKVFANTKAAKDALDQYKAKKDKESPGGVFRPYENDFSTIHWDEPNHIGHVRFNDRKGPNGEKILFIEEIQSDLHEKGRREGYRDSKQIENMPLKAKRFDGFWEIRNDEGRFITNVQDYMHPNVETADDAIAEARRRLTNEPQRTGNKGAPDAPWKKTWQEQLLRRMMRYAAEHGYDGVSWTPGEEQAERYDLSKQVSELRYRRQGDGNYDVVAYLQEGGKHEMGIIPPEKLADYVGKDVAEKMTKNEGEPSTQGRMRLVGEDLKVGGSGMRGFYDKIIPDAANKLGKQWGAKVGETHFGVPQGTVDALKQEADAKYDIWHKLKTEAEMGTGYVYGSPQSSAVDEAYDAWGEALDKYKEAKTRPEYTVPYLPITPQMRAGIKSIPYSLFGVGAAAAALSLNQLKAHAEMHNPKNVFVRDPTGHIHVFKDQQSANNFKREANIP